MKRGARGFSLLEVLVAFLIVALVLGAALPLIGQGLQGTHAAERRTMALLHAESRLAELAALGDPRGEARAGELPGGFAWRSQSQPVESGAGQRILLLRVSVTWRGARSGEDVALSTLLVVPEMLP
ncbi:MAG: prepilin-type N-terminal cleavage/methylation domain-containing protein [Alphaproteobacteria bacterium]|nr:prepilin-type N-terminal cleavage/methylation domain-containing protein [Alphaproteobacteria bacterium]